jgi:DHA2 family multidrug resistance protein
VGFLQGLVSPLAGVFSDRYNGKIPLVIGILLMAYTFYQFGFLAPIIDKRDIMLPLYLRGIAMGMLFAPLITLAISEIPVQKMAQASGLVNVVRQIGGSFGVAVFGTILTRRTIYHAALYGQQIDPSSPSLQQTLARLQYSAIARTGGTASTALARARVQLGSFVANQAFVRAIDDVFLIAAVIVALTVIPVFFLRIHKRARAGRRIA